MLAAARARWPRSLDFLAAIPDLSTRLSSTAAWERSRLVWLATGSAAAAAAVAAAPAPAPAPAAPGEAEGLARAVADARAALRRPRAKPVRVREQNILNALRDPHRLVEFSRPLPLPRMIDLITTLWADTSATTTR